MPFTLYKASPSIKGAGIGFSVNSKDQAIYVSMVQQSNWDGARKVGTFAGAKANFKFTISEVGGFIHTILKNQPLKLYHQIPGKHQTSIEFSPWFVDAKDANGQLTGKKEQKGYGFRATKTEGTNKTNFNITISLGESYAILEWLRFALEKCYSAIYSQDKKDAEVRIKSKEEKKPQNEAPNMDGAEPASIPADDFDF